MAKTSGSAKKAAGKQAQAMPTVSEMEAPAKGFRADVRELWAHFGGVAGAGLVIGGLAAAFSATGAPGIVSTVQDLWSHAWAIHPFFYVLVACVVCVAVILQGQDISKLYLDRFFTQPLLSAMAHTLSFAAGLVIPLCLVVDLDWASGHCHGFVGVAVLLFTLLVFALMAVGGLIVVQRRIAEEKAKASGGDSRLSAEKASGPMLLLFLVLAITFAALGFITARQSGTTEHVVFDVLKTIESGICTH